MTQSLDATDIEAALREMGEELRRARVFAEIGVFGGAAILLQLRTEFRTGDVDAVVTEGDHGAVMRAAEAIARRRGWLRSWFSDAVSVYLGTEFGRTLHGTYPSEGPYGLRVFLAEPDYLLAMKLRAMRVGTRDYADARALAEHTGISNAPLMLDLLARFFPKEPVDARRRVIVAQFAESLRAPLSR
jgi:hypothetical protein